MAFEFRFKKRAEGPVYAQADELVLWAKDDGKMWTTDEDGTEAEVGPGGGGSGSSFVGPFTIYGLQSQGIDASGDIPDGGTLTLAYDGVDSDPIAADADEAATIAALEAIPALTGKIVSAAGTPIDSGAHIITVVLDESLAPFEAFTISDNSLVNGVTPVADPLLYCHGGTTTNLLTPEAGDVIEDFQISVPQNEAFGNSSEISFAPEDGDADWPQGFGLILDSEDASETWTTSQDGDSPGGAHSVVQAIAADLGANNGHYPSLPCVCNVPSAIQANVERAGQGTGGTVLVWVKKSAVTAPA